MFLLLIRNRLIFNQTLIGQLNAEPNQIVKTSTFNVFPFIFTGGIQLNHYSHSINDRLSQPPGEKRKKIRTSENINCNGNFDRKRISNTVDYNRADNYSVLQQNPHILFFIISHFLTK